MEVDSDPDDPGSIETTEDENSREGFENITVTENLEAREDEHSWNYKF